MKKLLLLTLTLITMALFSSCLVVHADVNVGPDYDITCYNNTSVPITDWCVKRNDHCTYANSDYNCAVYAGERDTIYDLPGGSYQIFFTFRARTKLHEWDYDEPGHFDLDEDVTFYVAQRSIYSNRSAGGSAQGEDAKEFVLICSNGKTYPLTPFEK